MATKRRKRTASIPVPFCRYPEALVNPCDDCAAVAGAVCVENGLPLPTLHEARRNVTPRKPLKTPRRVQSRSENDQAYRRALGLPDGAALPGQLGAHSSAGASRGGRGAAHKGKGKYS